MFSTFATGPNSLQEKPPIQGLLDVFAVFKKHKLTLRTFLEKVIDCENEHVKRYVGKFYSNGGPSHITKLWMAKHPKDTELANIAVTYVLSFARKELMTLAMDKRLHVERPSYSASSVHKFSMAHINQRLASSAPLIFKILQGLTQPKKLDTTNPRRRSLAVPIIGSILAFTRCNRSRYLQITMGLYLYSAGCTRKVIDVLHGAGLCVSFPTINRLLKDLTEKALERIKEAAGRDEWFFVYDNINFAKRKYDQRVGNADDFESGTTATMIIGERLTHYPAHQIRDSYSRLSSADFMMDEADDAHALRKNLEGYDLCFPPNIDIHQLTPTKTATFPLPTMKIDESSLEGNKAVVETIIEEVLGLEEGWFASGKMVVIAGDLSTVKKLRGLKDLRSDEHSLYHRLDWALPVAQLFHMQMLLARTIVHNYRGSADVQGSLEQLATMLQRKRVFSDNPEFHAMDELLRHVFTATVLRLWEVSMEDKEMCNLRKYSNDIEFNNLINDKVMEVIDRDINTSNIEDIPSRNATLFLRDMMLYMELSSAIKIGDIGRIEKALKWLTIVFHAGSTPHYAYELMHFRCCVTHVWDEQTKIAILSSMLVNKSGERNGWKPTDLYQEHHNRSIKHVHYSRQGDTSFDTLRERISTNIETFDDAKDQMEKQFQAPKNKRKHAAVSADTALDDILTIFRENNILGHDISPCVQKCKGTEAAKDLLFAGTIALQDEKRIRAFIDKHTYDSQGFGEEVENEA
ncbi:hypothetical protein BGZ91_006062 [Linnemannia elongata]|nr:hypothetical protein BGZ91_006062 [Linnemannia elongata]